MDTQINEPHISEQMEIPDTPGFEITDLIGEYKVVTRRKGTSSSMINCYETQVILEPIMAKVLDLSKTKVLRSEIVYRLDLAMDNHENQIKNLASMVDAA